MGWRRWIGAGGDAVQPPVILAFDALVDLGTDALLAGVGREAAIAAVVKAVEAVPGAGWISVGLHRQATPVAAKVFPAGTSDVRDGDAWQSLRSQIEAIALHAVSALSSAASAPSIANPEGTTFEEAMAQRRRLDRASFFRAVQVVECACISVRYGRNRSHVT